MLKHTRSLRSLPWILSAQVVGVYGEEGPAKLLKAFALAASTAQNTFPPKGDAVLISQASARVPPQRETFRTVLSDAAHDIHHKSVSYLFSSQGLSLDEIMFIFCFPMSAPHSQDWAQLTAASPCPSTGNGH